MDTPQHLGPRTSVNWQPFLYQALVHAAVVFALLVVFYLVVPGFMRNFEELDLSLPALTVLIVNLSNYLVMRWFIALPVVMILLAFDLAALAGLRMVPKVGPILSTVWFLAGIAFLGLVVLLTVAGLFLPLNSLVNDLSMA